MADILITGITGRIGANLASTLVQDGHSDKDKEPDQHRLIYYSVVGNWNTKTAHNWREERQNNQGYFDPVEKKA